MADEIPFYVPQFRLRRLPHPELRKDPIVDRWVAFSTDRAGRPLELSHDAPVVERLAECPFCAGNESLAPQAVAAVPASREGGWRVRVVPNRYPVLRLDAAPVEGSGLFLKQPGIGAHEVIIESPSHDRSPADLPVGQLELVLRVYRDRLNVLAGDSRLRYGLLFKNHGAGAGASLEHVHSQLLALPHIPSSVDAELTASAGHYAKFGRCVYCELIDRERMAGERWIIESPRFVAIAAYAGRFAFETWVLPREHSSHYQNLPDNSLSDLALLLQQLFRRLAIGLNDPPYNIVLHTAPLGSRELPHFHWHLELLPRLTGVAGFEWGSGEAINIVPPEQAAAYLRRVELPRE
jgi:UDPglucose--hexose-1-phosphate uridylyltransferase